MSNILQMHPAKGSKKFKNGSRIYISTGNLAKVYESILLQVYTTISPQFKCIAVVLKKFIIDMNDHKSVMHKQKI